MEDERQEELDCIAAIFPEIAINPQDPFTASIELAINPRIPVKVVFPAASDGAQPSSLPTPPQSSTGQDRTENIATHAHNVQSHSLSYLPSLQLRINLPEGYPENRPPIFELSTTPPWLSQSLLDELQGTGKQMWEDSGRSLAVYGYIDFIQQAAENAFGLADDGKVLEAPQEFEISLLDYDIKAKQASFEKETFECGICLDPKKGSACHRMIDCDHVFCVTCLQDFYNNAIKEGDLVSVKCLAPDCAKTRAASLSKKKPKTQLSPSELLQIPLEHEMVTRYVKLKHKAELESDKNTIYCPRKWCQAAARSKRHRKPEGFEDTESGDESEDNDLGKPEKFRTGKDLLAVCEDCSFAFCSRCYQGWHGEFTVCVPKTSTGELTEEDKASLEYLKAHSTPCPTCAARAQKTHGCNHMICFKCNSHFCYLCSAWLEPGNPYKHYNQERAHCYMRLWELEEGDGDEADRIAAREMVQQEQLEAEEEAREQDHEVAEIVQDLAVENPVPAEVVPEAVVVAPQQAHQREGPLVLRINQVPRQAIPLPVPDVAEPPQPGRRHRRNRPREIHYQPGGRRQIQQGQRQNVRGENARDPGAQEAAQQAWVQMFVQMALNDEEDQLGWHSEDEDDAAAWEIPVR